MLSQRNKKQCFVKLSTDPQRDREDDVPFSAAKRSNDDARASITGDCEMDSA